MKERPSTWKKLSAVSEAAAQPGTMAVKQQRSYHLNDEDETEVEPDSVAKGERGRGERVVSVFFIIHCGDDLYHTIHLYP